MLKDLNFITVINRLNYMLITKYNILVIDLLLFILFEVLITIKMLSLYFLLRNIDFFLNLVFLMSEYVSVNNFYNEVSKSK